MWPGISTANGAQVQEWQWLGGSNQKWKLTDVGSGYWTLIPQHATGSCLDVNGFGTANGSKLQIWQTLQQRRPEMDNLPPPAAGITSSTRNAPPAVCLDVDGFGTGNGTKVQLWQDLGNDAQKWQFQKQ